MRHLSSNELDARARPTLFQVTFGEGRFGFTLFKEENGPRKGKGVVSKVHAGTSAERLGVHLGDVVIGVNMRR